MSATAPRPDTSRRLYYDDSYTTRFAARVASRGEHKGRPAVELESTYFYPESGGQEADRGKLGAHGVLDVQADDDGRVWHVLAAADAPAGAEIEAEVDWARRFDNMQQHTGQHVLSAAFERVANAPTVSSHLGDESSSIEVAIGNADWKLIQRIEEATNRVLWEDRPVERHWTDSEGVKRFQLRKPPVVSGPIRVVEIPEWDASACGGTHTKHTGEVGIVKIVRWEKVRGNVRFEFLCGGRALRDHAWRTEALLEAAKKRTLKDRELLAHLEKAAEERDELKKRLRELTNQALAAEARARVGDPPRGVAEWSDSRAREDVRMFTLKCLEAGAPWVACAAGAPDAVIVLGRAKSGSADLRTILSQALEKARGKGGGSPDLVQIAAADSGAAKQTFEWAREAVNKLVAGA